MLTGLTRFGKRPASRSALVFGLSAVLLLTILPGSSPASAAGTSANAPRTETGTPAPAKPEAGPSAPLYPERPHWIPQMDVLIDVGHGGIDGGATHGDILEKDINLAMAKQLYAVLQERDLLVSINRIGDYALSDDNLFHKFRSRHKRDLAQRSGIANRLQPKLMVSLHVNSVRSSSASGPLVLHQKSDESKRLAGLIQQQMNRYYGTEETPEFGRKYYILNQSKCPTVIVEMGYLSNAGDRQRLLAPAEQRKLAESIADGIQLFLREAYSDDQAG